MESNLVQVVNQNGSLTCATQQENRNAATEYLKTLGSKASRNAVYCRLNRVAQWFGYPDAEHCDWNLMRYTHVIQFLDYLKTTEEVTSHHQNEDKKLKHSTVNSYIYAIKAVSKTAWALNQMSDHDLLKIQSIKPARGYEIPSGRALSFQESKTLIKLCDGNEPYKIRDKAIITLMLGCGLRRGEVAGIRISNINYSEKEIKILGKGNKERMIYLNDAVFEAVKKWVDTRATIPVKVKESNAAITDYLFCRFTRYYKNIITSEPIGARQIWSIVNQYVDLASVEIPEIKDIKCHDCRRTFATRLFGRGVDIAVIRNLMGHSSIATTAMYDKRGKSAMKQAMEDTVI